MDAPKSPLDALSAPRGAEDTRTHAQRHHDALGEAMKRLIAGGLLPERAGQPVKVWAHVALADLMKLEGSSALLEQWTADARARLLTWAWARCRLVCSDIGLPLLGLDLVTTATTAILVLIHSVATGPTN